MKRETTLVALLCLLSCFIGGLLTYTYTESKLPEPGAGYIVVHLHDSAITVMDVDGDTLYTKQAHKGDWDKIWEAIDDQYWENYYR